MKFQILIMVVITLAGCSGMDPLIQEQVGSSDIKMAMPSIEIPTTLQMAGVNLHLPDGKILITNPTFNGGDDSEPRDPNFDDFVIGIQALAVPNSAFTVRWEIMEKDTLKTTLIEDVILRPDSQSWIVGIRWDNAHSGDHILQVTLDPDNAVTETNEEDNVYTVSFSIPD